MKQQIPARTTLRAGQSLHLYAPAGTTFVAARGAVRITSAKDWREEHAIQATFLLHEGEAHVAGSAGWIVISSQSDVELACPVALAKSESLLDQLIGLLGNGMRRGIL